MLLSYSLGEVIVFFFSCLVISLSLNSWIFFLLYDSNWFYRLPSSSEDYSSRRINFACPRLLASLLIASIYYGSFYLGFLTFYIFCKTYFYLSFCLLCNLSLYWSNWSGFNVLLRPLEWENRDVTWFDLVFKCGVTLD